MDNLKGQFVEARFGGQKVLIQVHKDDNGILVGYRVDKTGVKFARRHKATFEEFMFVFKRDAVIRILTLNNHYGELE